MYGLLECMSSGCVAQKGDHAKIFWQVIQGWDITLDLHLKTIIYDTSEAMTYIYKNIYI